MSLYQREPFKDLKTGIVHGRMKAKEKDAVMKAFEKTMSVFCLLQPSLKWALMFPMQALWSSNMQSDLG